MQTNFILGEETFGYQTSTDPSNSDRRLLIAGSKNVLIDYQRKVKIRPGYTRLGVANTSITENRNAWTWDTSTGFKVPQKFYDDELEAYLTSVDGIEINAWTRISNGWSTTKKLRADTVFDATENIDLQIMVNGNDNLYEFNGAFAVVASVTAVTITKEGTQTFAENRFYTTRDKTVVCVRTGSEYTYTGGEGSTTLTGIADTTGLQAGDILVQKIVTTATSPASGRNNDTIHCFENQIILGSETDELIYGSKNNDYNDFAFSSPRAAGEGFKLTLTDDTRAINSLGSLLLIFAGRSTIFKVEFEQLAVGSSIVETVRIKKIDTGIDQGALNHECVIPIGNSLAYLSNEVALRIISNPEDLTGIDPRTFSNPIKPDFDAEDWDVGNTYMTWYKNIIFITAAAGSRTYMLNFIEDADGKLLRFWNPPQVLPIGPMSVIDSGNGPVLHGHSNAVPETYLLFDGQSDGQYLDMNVEDKLPIDARAVFAYNSFGKRGHQKNFDEYYVEGEITPSTTDLGFSLNYDFEGSTQILDRTIDGSDEDILEGVVGFNSLAQQSLGSNPLGSLLNPPSTARKFRTVLELAKEDFHQLGVTFSTNDVDRYWAIIAHGPNAMLSPRKNTTIRK